MTFFIAKVVLGQCIVQKKGREIEGEEDLYKDIPKAMRTDFWFSVPKENLLSDWHFLI